MACNSFVELINNIAKNIYPDFLAKYEEAKKAVVPLEEIYIARDIAVSKASESATSASASELRAWKAEAERRTADSFRSAPENTYVSIYTSNGDGTFAVQTIPSFSTLHYKQKAEQASALLAEGADAFIPFIFADGTSQNLKVIEIGSNSYIPFVLADGTSQNIPVLGV